MPQDANLRHAQLPEARLNKREPDRHIIFSLTSFSFTGGPLVQRLELLFHPALLLAGAAGLVFDCAAKGDVYASDIVRSGTDYLSSIARIAMEKSQGKLVLAGGLAGTIRPFLPEDIRAKIIEARYGPEWGAVHVRQD